jgi:hypothetical protein
LDASSALDACKWVTVAAVCPGPEFFGFRNQLDDADDAGIADAAFLAFLSTGLWIALRQKEKQTGINAMILIRLEI